MYPVRVYACDPGESTGWAYCEYINDDVVDLTYGWGPYRKVAKELYEAMQSPYTWYNTVIYETWRLRKDKADEFIGSPIIPIQAVGFTIAAVEFTKPGTPIVGQEPALKKVIDKQMLGFKRPNYLPAYDGAEHARDAVRHLYYYLVNKKGYRP